MRERFKYTDFLLWMIKEGVWMKNKAWRVVLLLVLVTSLFLSGCSLPDNPETEEVFDYVVTFAWAKDIGVLKEPLAPFDGLVRILLLVVLILGLMKGGEAIGLDTGVAAGIAIAVASMVAFLVPSTIIFAGATGYTVIFSILVAGLPIALLFLAFFAFNARTTFGKWGRVIVMTISVVVLHLVRTALESYLDPWQIGDFFEAPWTAITRLISSGDLGSGGIVEGVTHAVADPVHSIFGFVLFLAYILLFWSIFQALTTLGGANRHRPNAFGRAGDWVKNHISGTEASRLRRSQSREATRVLNDLVVEKEIKGELEDLRKKKLNTYMNHVSDVGGATPQFKSLEDLTTFENDFKKVYDAFKKLSDDRDWKASQRKESIEVQRLIKRMESHDIDTENIAVQEQQLLKRYVAVRDQLRKASAAFTTLMRAHFALYKRVKIMYDALGRSDKTALLKPVPLPAGAINNLKKVQAAAVTFDDALGQAIKFEDEAIASTGVLSKMVDDVNESWIARTS